MNVLSSLLLANFVLFSMENKAIDVGLIPDDIICPFCIALIEKFQQTTHQNSDFKSILCESISAKNRKNYHTCIRSFNEVTVEKLKTLSADDLCRSQKICPIDYKKVILTANTGKVDFPRIPVVTDEQLKDAERHDILRTLGDILTGKLEASSGKNLTLHIDLEFRKSQPDETETTTLDNLTDSN
ncbi:unnamed protein product [Litomosoides sigmodontis]|uniref:Saposin B-type domain-containing protein n=1 Tax=Litomosoides sigmodontis TaxID=42156 RepID=A0A3P6SWS6_LITSI|nr:unnamed protein product [Litomosoides sigmodontis]